MASFPYLLSGSYTDPAPAPPSEEERKEATQQKAIEIAERSLQELLAAPSPDWEAAAELYQKIAQHYFFLENRAKCIEYLIQAAFCQLRAAKYEKTSRLFNSVRFQVSSLSEETSKSQYPLTLATLLSTHLPQLLPLDVVEGLCPFLLSSAKLYAALKAHEQAASYFALCGTCYISNNWEAANCFYEAGIAMSQSPPSLATCEKTISFFKKAVLAGASTNRKNLVEKALKQLSLQYLSLDRLDEATAALKQRAEVYPFFTAKTPKYLSEAISLCEKLNDFQNAADCLMRLVEFYKEKTYFLPAAETAHKAARYYIQSGALAMADTSLSKAASYYRHHSPPLWKKSMECIELQANLLIQQNLPEETGLCLYRAAMHMKSHKNFELAAHCFAAAVEHLILAKNYELAIEALDSAGELYARERLYAYSGQAFEGAAFLCKALQKKRRLTHFFYFAGEGFYNAREYLRAATCYEQAVRARPFAADHFRMHEYNTAATQARHCREKLAAPYQEPPSFVPPPAPVKDPWEAPIESCLRECAQARHPEAIKILIEKLDQYKKWPQIMDFIREVPFPTFSDPLIANSRRKYFLFNCHTDKMSSDIHQSPLINHIKDVSTVLLTRAAQEL